MAGYIWHIIHAYETYMNLLPQTRSKMPKDALRNIITGCIIPDLVSSADKQQTHYYKAHPIYGESYKIPDMEKVKSIFFKRDPIYLGVVSHLQYDKDHIEKVLLIYARPLQDGRYLNTTTGETISELRLFGNWKDVYGQLYQLYDKFNREMAIEFTPKLNQAFETQFTANKNGFISFIKWLYPQGVPMSGILEIDSFRNSSDIVKIMETFFDNDGESCTLSVEIDDLVQIVKKSAESLAKQIDDLYAE